MNIENFTFLLIIEYLCYNKYRKSEVYMKGLFISFEGNDGSGKSSVIKKVVEELQKMNFDVLVTREPGGSSISEKIRDIVLDPQNIGMDPVTEAYLYAASRREHVQKVINPALQEGKVVICDRYIDSSLAYQGGGRELGIDNVLNINKYAVESTIPDLTIILCVKPEIGLNRINKFRHEKDRLEQETIEFHKRVYDAYQVISKMYPNRIALVNGEGSLEEECNLTLDVVLKFLKEHR
jgi:dTMP kinase